MKNVYRFGAFALAVIIGVTSLGAETVGAKVVSVRLAVVGVTSLGVLTVGAKPVSVRLAVLGVTKRGVLTVGAKPVSASEAVDGVTDTPPATATEPIHRLRFTTGSGRR